jgi:hypothetical protein|tara:strand:+ start:272 stop:511 length:240 start_codon:yes stop_codon:yes gene_type:complete
MSDKIYIDIAPRASDSNYVVWERMPYSVITGESTEEQCKLKQWVSVAVFKTKSLATKYCTKRFGRNCFKENEAVAIVFM